MGAPNPDEMAFILQELSAPLASMLERLADYMLRAPLLRPRSNSLDVADGRRLRCASSHEGELGRILEVLGFRFQTA